MAKDSKIEKHLIAPNSEMGKMALDLCSSLVQFTDAMCQLAAVPSAAPEAAEAVALFAPLFHSWELGVLAFITNGTHAIKSKVMSIVEAPATRNHDDTAAKVKIDGLQHLVRIVANAAVAALEANNAAAISKGSVQSFFLPLMQRFVFLPPAVLSKMDKTFAVVAKVEASLKAAPPELTSMMGSSFVAVCPSVLICIWLMHLQWSCRSRQQWEHWHIRASWLTHHQPVRPRSRHGSLRAGCFPMACRRAAFQQQHQLKRRQSTVHCSCAALGLFALS